MRPRAQEFSKIRVQRLSFSRSMLIRVSDQARRPSMQLPCGSTRHWTLDTQQPWHIVYGHGTRWHTAWPWDIALDIGCSTRAGTEVQPQTPVLWTPAFFSQHMLLPSHQWWINRNHPAVETRSYPFHEASESPPCGSSGGTGPARGVPFGASTLVHVQPCMIMVLEPFHRRQWHPLQQ